LEGGMKKKKITIRVGEEELKNYKKWLIDKGFKSINEHINQIIKKISEEYENKNAVKTNKS